MLAKLFLYALALQQKKNIFRNGCSTFLLRDLEKTPAAVGGSDSTAGNKGLANPPLFALCSR